MDTRAEQENREPTQKSSEIYEEFIDRDEDYSYHYGRHYEPDEDLVY